MLESLRLYRLSTEAKFSFPLGKATSPAAVPLRPLRAETACSTPLITSRIAAAVVKLPGMGLPTTAALVRQAHPVRGFRSLENAGSMIPYIKNKHFFLEILGDKMNPRIPKPECMMQKFQTLTKLIYV